MKVPDPNTTLWTATGDKLGMGTPVTLSWDNGAGLDVPNPVRDRRRITCSPCTSRVRNTGNAAVQVFPWARIRRDYTPQVAGYYILHEGLLGIVDGRLKEVKYAEAKTDGRQEQRCRVHLDER